MPLGRYRISSRDFDKVLADFVKDADNVETVLVPTFRDIAIDWHGESKKAAPISPNKTQYLTTLKRPERSRADLSNFQPGGLEQSIKHKSGQAAGNVFAEVSVASNGPAKDYAFRIHSQRGTAWRNLGIGSLAKGTARDKYIEGPRDENLDNYGKLIEKRVAKHLEAE